MSCSEDEMIGVDYAQNRIIASVEMPEVSRTAMGNAVDGAVGVLWSPDDQIGVFEASGSAQKCYAKTTESANTDEAVFVVSGSDAFTSPMYAYYPYNEVNNGKSITSLSGNLPSTQVVDGKLHGDYKYGKVTSSSNQGHKVVFQHFFSMARVLVDASETPLLEENIESLNIAVTRSDAPVNIAGDFTFDAKNGKWSAGNTLQNNITLNWSEGVLLNEELTCYASLFPTVKAGDLFTITVTTQNYKAVFTATSKVNFSSEEIYTFPVKLSTFENIKYFDKDGNAMEDYELPAISEFGFQYDNNTTQLLNNELIWSNKKPSFESKTLYPALINEESAEITLTIPYLYDFKLIPTFKLSLSGDYTVSVNGVEQTSGVTAVDFTKPVIYTITNKVGLSRSYTVKIANTGLPVVVLKHTQGETIADAYTEGGFLGFGKKHVNNFVNFNIRPKDASFVKTDEITIYNADGTVDCNVMCGARLRGNTSQEYPKKPFAIKFKDDKPVLGMPAHKRWVLLANWLDHSMIRNTVAFDIAHAIENAWKEQDIEQGIPWNVHGQNVELIVIDTNGNAHHVGNYFFCEQIKIHENRLDIQDPYEDSGNSDWTKCGYLLEVDNNYDEDKKFKTDNSVPFMFKDAVTDDILSKVEQKVEDIEDYITESNYASISANLDIPSVIDQWLIWELTMNREYGDPRSVYMFMDGDGKLSAGPVWDFDRGTFQYTTGAKELGNSDRVKPYDAWICDRKAEDENCSYIWYRQLKSNNDFKAAVKARWTVLKPYLQDIVNKIETYRISQKESFTFDSAMWPTTKADVQAHKSGFSDWSGDEDITNFDKLIDTFKKSYEDRLNGMDKLINEF